MSDDLEKIVAFIDKHHVLSLATSYDNELSVCSLFYCYDKLTNSFIVASNDETTHINHIKKNRNIAANILLETKEVSKIQGLQLRGEFLELQNKTLQKLYFEKFPCAINKVKKFWSIEVNYFKMTDNSLGFAKKIILKDFSL